jgi:hypothetical protein
MLLEVLLQLTLRPAVLRMFHTGKGAVSSPKKLDAAASSALAKLVSTFHNAVAVRESTLSIQWMAASAATGCMTSNAWQTAAACQHCKLLQPELASYCPTVPFFRIMCLC